MSNHTPITLPVHVVHGEEPGPTIFVSASIHGDEILGVEIVRRLLKLQGLDRMAGTLLAAPIVNAFGFISHSRYLPDRRDLNRSFPGRANGSLAAQLADLFMREVVLRSDFGIDLHTGALHRENIPQIRIGPGGDALHQIACAFGAPLIIRSGMRDGSLRKAAQSKGVYVLVYEAGEALRFDEFSIRVGVRGIVSVLRHLKMLPEQSVSRKSFEPLWAESSAWERAPKGGILRAFRKPGEMVSEGERIAVVSDPFGEEELPVEARTAGLVIGRTNLPVVNRGDALFHIAEVAETANSAGLLQMFEDEIDLDLGPGEETI